MAIRIPVTSVCGRYTYSGWDGRVASGSEEGAEGGRASAGGDGGRRRTMELNEFPSAETVRLVPVLIFRNVDVDELGNSADEGEDGIGGGGLDGLLMLADIGWDRAEAKAHARQGSSVRVFHMVSVKV